MFLLFQKNISTAHIINLPLIFISYCYSSTCYRSFNSSTDYGPFFNLYNKLQKIASFIKLVSEFEILSTKFLKTALIRF